MKFFRLQKSDKAVYLGKLIDLNEKELVIDFRTEGKFEKWVFKQNKIRVRIWIPLYCNF
jgi:hypothetical protein